jgi:hypothetical protein
VSGFFKKISNLETLKFSTNLQLKSLYISKHLISSQILRQQKTEPKANNVKSIFHSQRLPQATAEPRVKGRHTRAYTYFPAAHTVKVTAQWPIKRPFDRVKFSRRGVRGIKGPKRNTFYDQLTGGSLGARKLSM